MARRMLVCTVIVAVFAAVLLGTQADSQTQPQDALDGIIKYAEKLLNRTMQMVEEVVHKAQDFINNVKQKIRDEEDKLLNQIPDPLGKLLKDIVNKIREAQEKKAELNANMTQCVTSEAQPAFDIVKNTFDGINDCVQQKTSDMKDTITDFENLIKQALSLIASAPKDLISCIKFPPTSETWSCITGKVQELSSKGLMLMSSLIGDMGTIGQQVPAVVKNIVNCGIEQRTEAEKKLGQIIEKIGACEKDVISKST